MPTTPAQTYGFRKIWTGLLIIAACIFSTECFAAELGSVTESVRAIERLGFLAVGALSLSFGFLLFRTVTRESGELIAKGGEWSLKISQVGPGVFFALFGAAIVITSIVTQVTIKQTPGPSGPVVELEGAIPVPKLNSDQTIDSILALNTVSHFFSGRSVPPDSEGLVALARAEGQLEPLKKALVNSHFGEGRYDEWFRLKEEQRTMGKTFTEKLSTDQKLRQRFNEIDKIMHKRFTAEGH